VITCCLVFFSLHAAAQKEIKLGLSEPENNSNSGIVPLNTMQVWATNNDIPDSVSWYAPYQTNYTYASRFKQKRADTTTVLKIINDYHIDTNQLNCHELKGYLEILSRRIKDSTQICILKKYNPFIDKETILTYLTNSLNKWTINDYPAAAVPRIKINLPYCVKNQTVVAQWEMFLFPFFSNITYQDKRLNKMPLSMSMGRVRVANFNNADIYFFKTEYSSPDSSSIKVRIRENGKMQEDKFSNNLKYKDEYNVTDTIVVNEKLYKVDSIAKNWQYVYLHAATGKENWHLRADKLAQLLPYFTNTKANLVIDFWGTWCAPCIAALPGMRDLQQKVKGSFNFLSICCDQPGNYTKAKEIFKENHIPWPQIFIDRRERANTLIADMDISAFPNYMIVTKTGNILFAGNGLEGFDELQKILLAKQL